MMKFFGATIALTLIGTASPVLYAGDPVRTEGGTELVDRLYDMSHLRIREADYESDGVVLFPTSQARIRPQMESWQSLSDEFISFASSVLWEEVEYDGRLLDSSDDAHLYLRAPESTQIDMHDLLQFFGRLCTAETEVALHWVRVPDGVATPSGLVASGTVADWLKGLPTGAVSSDLLRVPAYRAGVVRQTRETPTYVDANVEIAQGTAVVDGTTRSVVSGHWAMIHAVPGYGGVQLSMTWADVDQPQFNEVDLKLGSYFGAEGQGTERIEQGGILQLMHQPANVSSGRLFVPEGMASVTKVAGKDGTSTLLIAVPVKGPPVQQSFQLTSSRQDRGVAFLMGSLLPLQTNWSGEEAFGIPSDWLEQELCWRTQLDCSDWMADRALMGISQDLVEIRQIGGYLVLNTAHGVERDQLPVAHMELDRAVKRLSAWVVARPSYKVTLRGFQGADQEIFQVQQVVAEGSKSSWLCGAERTFIREFDTEVAQYAAIHDPNVMSIMEGSLIELILEPDGEGLIQAQIDARLNLPQGAVEMKSGSPLHGDHQRQVYQTTRFNNLQKLTPTNDTGSFTAEFGGRGPGAIRLELRVDPVQ